MNYFDIYLHGYMLLAKSNHSALFQSSVVMMC